MLTENEEVKAFIRNNGFVLSGETWESQTLEATISQTKPEEEGTKSNIIVKHKYEDKKRTKEDCIHIRDLAEQLELELQKHGSQEAEPTTVVEIEQLIDEKLMWKCKEVMNELPADLITAMTKQKVPTSTLAFLQICKKLTMRDNADITARQEGSMIWKSIDNDIKAKLTAPMTASGSEQEEAKFDIEMLIGMENSKSVRKAREASKFSGHST